MLLTLTAELSRAMSNELKERKGYWHMGVKFDYRSGVGTVKHRSTQMKAARGMAMFIIMQRGQDTLRL